MISSVIMVVLAVIGAAEVICCITRRLFKTGDKADAILVWQIPRGEKHIEQKLRSFILTSDNCGCKKLCVLYREKSLDGEALEICKKICAENGNIRLMTAREFVLEFENEQ